MLIKNAKKPETQTVFLGNDRNGIISMLAGFDQKTLVDIDLELDGKLTDISIIKTKTPDDTEILNLGLIFPDRKVLVPLSRGFGDEVENDPMVLLNGRFYIANRFDKDKDTEGEYPYSGPKYISFGKTGTINIVEEKSLINAETTA